MNNIIPFNSKSLPAYLAKGPFKVATDLSVSSGFASLSIKGKEFTVVRGSDKETLINPETDEPATFVDVAIINYNPHVSKTYYATKFVDGEDAKPTCYSNNGVSPEADAEEPQSTKCATCPHNQWGSRISDSGGKGKACGDGRRLAVATTDAIDDPMLLRVPATSQKNLGAYQKEIARKGYPVQAVVVRIGFERGITHPQLTFKPIGLINEDTYNEISMMFESDLVMDILGLSPVAAPAAPAVVEEEEEDFELPPATAPKPKAKKKPAPVVVEDEEEDEEEEAPAPAPAPKHKAKKKPAPVVVEEEDEDDDDIEDIDDIESALDKLLS